MIFDRDGAVYTIDTVFEATANDSDKSWVVPAGEVWELNFASVILATSAAVGNRSLHMDVYDESNNEVCSIVAGVVQAASANVTYSFMQGIYRETAVVNGGLQVPVPHSLLIPAGFTLRFYDAAAIAAAADDMTVAFQVKNYKPKFVA